MEYLIESYERAGLADLGAVYLQELGMTVAKFEAAGFSDYGVAHCRAMDSDHWPEGWALKLPPPHRPLSLNDFSIDLAGDRYRLAEMGKVVPPPELQAQHEADLEYLRLDIARSVGPNPYELEEDDPEWGRALELEGAYREAESAWRSAERAFWERHGPDLDGNRFDTCGWPGVLERMGR